MQIDLIDPFDSPLRDRQSRKLAPTFRCSRHGLILRSRFRARGFSNRLLRSRRENKAGVSASRIAKREGARARASGRLISSGLPFHPPPEGAHGGFR